VLQLRTGCDFGPGKRDVGGADNKCVRVCVCAWVRVGMGVEQVCVGTCGVWSMAGMDVLVCGRATVCVQRACLYVCVCTRAYAWRIGMGVCVCMYVCVCA